MEMSLAEILNMPLEDIKEPQALPPGTYLCIVDGQPELTKIGQNQTDCIQFSLKPLQPCPDVDPAALMTALDGSNLSDKKIRHRLFLTNESKHRAKKFLVNDLGLEGSNLASMLPESMGKQVYVKLAHQSSQDGTTVYHNVVSTAKV